ncbi:UNVERIFIED_CONTAM: hypothetical protein NY603_24250 [Bacteroidetes bacterium 56_B9]
MKTSFQMTSPTFSRALGDYRGLLKNVIADLSSQTISEKRFGDIRKLEMVGQWASRA